MITIAKEQNIVRYEGAKSVNDALAKEAISESVAHRVHFLENKDYRKWRVDLNDTGAVKAAAVQYLRECANIGDIPNVGGLAGALGISRQWLNAYIRENPSSATARFLEPLKEMLADTLLQAGLKRHYSESVTIFALKNSCVGMADKLEVEAIPASASTEEIDAAELKARIMGSIPAEDFDEMEDF